MASRLGLKAVGASIAGAFGGLLGSGLGRIPPHGMLMTWRWIFLVEGLLTVTLAGVVFVLMPGDVETSTFLTEEEREVANRRIFEENMTSGEERMDLEAFKKALWNPNTQMTGLALIMSLLSLTSLSLFMVSTHIAPDNHSREI
jgi:MFS family permease